MTGYSDSLGKGLGFSGGFGDALGFPSLIAVALGIDLPYDDVEALNPSLFLQLRYPIYDGRQLLFQDAACTVPVTAAGEHAIGGVKDPFTGQVVATQPSATLRPIWGGAEAGAVFTGNEYLGVSFAGSSGTEPWSLTLNTRQAVTGTFEYALQYGAPGSGPFAWVRSRNDGKGWQYAAQDDDSIVVTTAETFPVEIVDVTVREPISLRFAYESSESTLTAKHGSLPEVINVADPSNGITLPTSITLGNQLGGGANGLGGNITELSIKLGADVSYVEALHAALQDITVGPYDDLGLFDPSMFVQLRYPVYEGKYVLFQDPACTVPVKVAGQDRIGGVKSPFTGDIVATQPVFTQRPIWGGTAVGAEHDGTNYLVMNDFDFPSTSMTMLSRVEPFSLTNMSIIGLLDGQNETAGGFSVNLRNFGDPALTVRLTTGEDGVSSTSRVARDAVRVNSGSHVATNFDSNISRAKIYIDGTVVQNAGVTETDITPNHPGRGLGARWLGTSGVYDFRFDGTIEWIGISNLVLADDEISSTTDIGTTPEPFDDVEPLGTNYFFQLRYATYRGKQVLYQDAACTVPVSSVGQHKIGGVKDPFTGEIIATQPIDGRRPLWEGTSGAYFDGGNSLVVADDPSIQAGTTLSIADFAAVRSEALAGAETVFQKRDADSTTLYFTRIESNGKISAGHKDDLGNQTNGNTAPGVISAGTDYLVTLQYDRPNTATETWVGTTREKIDLLPVLNDISVDGRDIGYGAIDSGGTFTQPLNGYIHFAGQFLQTDAISVEEITILDNLV